MTTASTTVAPFTAAMARLRTQAAARVNYRHEPHRYRIGRGEEGVLTVEPYKSEIGTRHGPVPVPLLTTDEDSNVYVPASEALVSHAVSADMNASTTPRDLQAASVSVASDMATSGG